MKLLNKSVHFYINTRTLTRCVIHFTSKFLHCYQWSVWGFFECADAFALLRLYLRYVLCKGQAGVSVSEALSTLSPNIPFLAYKLKQKHAEIEELLAPEDHPYAVRPSTQQHNGRALFWPLSQESIHPSVSESVSCFWEPPLLLQRARIRPSIMTHLPRKLLPLSRSPCLAPSLYDPWQWC